MEWVKKMVSRQLIRVITTLKARRTTYGVK